MAKSKTYQTAAASKKSTPKANHHAKSKAFRVKRIKASMREEFIEAGGYDGRFKTRVVPDIKQKAPRAKHKVALKKEVFQGE